MRNSPRLRMVGVLCMAALLAAASPRADAPIADAAMQGDVQTVRTLLRQGADVNAAQGDGMTALHWAAEGGAADLAQMLLSAGANPRAVTRLGAYTPLHLASKLGHAPVIEVLLKGGANPNAVTTSGGATALHFAASSGNAAAVRALLEAGATVDAREAAWSQTPLMFAANYNHIDVMKALIQKGADVNATTRVVDFPAVQAVDQEAGRRRNQVLAAFRAGEGPNWRPEPMQVQAAVQAARQIQMSKQGSADDVEEEVSGGGEGFVGYSGLVGRQGGMSPLLYAARQGHHEAASLLLDNGASINQVSRGDKTSPMLMAILNGHFDLGLKLLERGADPNLASDAGAAPLFAALNLEWAPKARYPQPNAHTFQQATYLEVMEALLKAGANPNARLTKHLWYLSYTFDLLDIDATGATPFWRAAYAQDVPAMKLLVAHGADHKMPTIKPPSRGRRGGGAQADPSGLPPIPDGGPGVYPIQAAAGVGFGEGFAANAHRGAPGSWLAAMKYLVEELGHDVNSRDHNGYTALHHAAARGDNQMINYLVEKGADVMVVSRRGQTTVDMANGPAQRISPFPATIALLESMGAKNNNNCLSC